MDKIIFKNGEAPYINDENLNALQDNMENAINTLEDNLEEINSKKLLWSGTCNIGDTIALNDDILNYKLLYIRTTTGEGYCMCPINEFRVVKGIYTHTNSNTKFELISVRGKVTEDKMFTLNALCALSITNNGTISSLDSVTYISEIWGIK